MKKYILLLVISFLIGGCQKKFNDIIDASITSNTQVKDVTTTNSFTYSASDSLLVVGISLTSSKDVQEVFCNVFDSDGAQLNSDPVQLLDNGNIKDNGDTTKGDLIYSNKFPLSHSSSQVNYQIKYYVTLVSNNANLVAAQTFRYYPGISNVAPVISNLVMPDSVSIGDTFIFTVAVSDSNGLSDVASVYFNVYRPDGTALADNGSTNFLMVDDGDFVHFGDATAGDGIYSYKNSFASTAPKGKWKFVFQAKDKGGLLSNTITHYIVVK